MNSATYYPKLDLRNYPLREGSCPEARDDRLVLVKESFNKLLWFSEAVFILQEFEFLKNIFLNVNFIHFNDFMPYTTSQNTPLFMGFLKRSKIG